MKKFTILILSLSMLLNCAVIQAADADPENHTLEMKTVPFYVGAPQNQSPDGFPLYFADGVEDLPYVELDTWAQLLNELIPTIQPQLDTGFRLEVISSEQDQTVSLVRENGSLMYVDFIGRTLTFDDYGAFVQHAAGPYQDMVNIPSLDASGNPNLLVQTETHSRHGETVILDLAKYEIPMIAQDGKFLLPLQTLSAFTLYGKSVGMYYNGECLILANIASMKIPAEEMQNALLTLVSPETVEQLLAMGMPQEMILSFVLEQVSATDEGEAILDYYRTQYENSIYKLYNDGPKGERSETLAAYGYHELLLELDCFYGLKDAHHITDFESFLLSTSLAEDLAGPSVEKADTAVGTLTEYYLDDGHSTFLSYSSLLDADTEDAFTTGFGSRKSSALAMQLGELRQEYPDALEPYFEVGNTAYVRLDSFDFDYSIDYYAAAESGTLPDPSGDTVSLLYQAHQKITRENSPIENVVLDLSMNIGGTAPAAVYTLAWFLGETRFSTYNTFFGSETTSVYKADLNLDHVYDENDTISNLNLYCLISPMSFSCGNLVPWAFKEDGRVTLLGRVSGGGSCAVFSMTTAWGTSFRLSGCDRFSFVKNGSYYDVDCGVEPDYIIRSYQHFYDRQALTEYINQLF